MSVEIEFVGAAQTVTGSRHLLHTPKATVLLDCGLYQGRRRQSREQNEQLGFRASDIHAVVLSHAHIDHSGALPMLGKQGYGGPIYTTPATRDLCAVMLEDAAMIQASDARVLNRAIEREELDSEPVTPLYEQKDVERVLGQMLSVPYHMRHPVAPGVFITFFDAGHVLGSAVTAIDVEDGDKQVRIVFTGDLGRHHLPILRDPEVPSGAHALIMESTYGDRLHPSISEMDEALADVVTRTAKRGGKIVIPSFALERAQEVIFSLKKLRLADRIPDVPVYVDSPLTVSITEVFRLHPDCYDAESRELLSGGHSPFDFPNLHYISDVESSKALAASDGPAIIISASGMCEAGRVLHHLRATVEDPKNSIITVGFMAQHTLGRRIVEKRSRIKIFGVERDLRAEVAVLEGFSAHADKAGLLAFAEAVQRSGSLQQVALVHGEPPAQNHLRNALTARGIANVLVPAAGERMRVG